MGSGFVPAGKPAGRRSGVGIGLLVLLVAGAGLFVLAKLGSKQPTQEPTEHAVHCVPELCVPETNWTQVKACVSTLLADKRCDDTKVVIISAAKMPHVARNIKA